MMTDPSFTIPPDSLNEADFMTAFGGIYEHSPWVAATIWSQGLGPDDRQLAHFARRMQTIVDAAGHDSQKALLCAHPELAGKLAIAGGLTAESSAEQAGAGLDSCTPDEFARFSSLNDRYSDSFGHPFIIAVRGLDRAAILSAFEARIDNDPETEFATALAEVHKIARLRLELLCQ
jgi:2-oxo-4-hydroxy-4-carboxy-5-ureidoimidazoline decarboxylase